VRPETAPPEGRPRPRGPLVRAAFVVVGTALRASSGHQIPLAICNRTVGHTRVRGVIT
jgi:hypothetical protein